MIFVYGTHTSGFYGDPKRKRKKNTIAYNIIRCDGTGDIYVCIYIYIYIYIYNKQVEPTSPVLGAIDERDSKGFDPFEYKCQKIC